MNQTSDPSGDPRPDGASAAEAAELASLEAKITALLPRQYHRCLDSVKPTSMGSAGLIWGGDGKVAWGQIWTSFCDLALAGGPPHRGSLLGPPSPEEVRADPGKCQEVAEEVARGVRLTTGLAVVPAAAPGWVSVRCHDEPMAAWLLRAVMAENVFVRREKDVLQLPVGPRFCLDKEVKNVVVATAKTCHYWADHFSAGQREAAAVVMRPTGEGSALVEPTVLYEALAAADEYAAAAERTKQIAERAAGLPLARDQAGWVAVACHDQVMAAWLVRALIAENILARREESVLHLPVALPRLDEGRLGKMAETLARVRRLWDVHLARRPAPEQERDGLTPPDEPNRGTP
jgi:hypothetical protein